MFSFALSPSSSIPKHCYSSSTSLLLLFLSRSRSRSCSSSTSTHVKKNLSLLLQGPLSPPHIIQIHARVLRFGVDQDNLIATRLIGRHSTRLALRVFSLLRNPNIFPFNATIRILAETGLFPHAFSLFKTLRLQSLSPNDFTFSFLLKACCHSKDAYHVHQTHTHIVKLGFDLDPVVCNALLAVYAKGVRDLLSARKLLEEMPEGNLSSWTSLIAGYAQLGQSEDALLLFLQMIKENLRPLDDTMVSVLSACSNMKPQDIERWESLLLEFRNHGQYDYCYDAISTVLIYLYGKKGEIEKSRDAFDTMTEKSVLSWNAMIGGYVQNGYPIDALSLFRIMVADSNPKPNHVTMVSVLSACAQVGDLDLGRWVHEYMKVKGCKGILESNAFLATAFIDMYSKCGSLGRAKEVFDRMSTKDAVSFNAMIMGLAINGEGERSLELFYKMKVFGVHPNDGTFVGVLCACTHSGLVAQGRALFANMKKHYLVTPKLEHYACYIDLLARAGNVEEALEVVRMMPVQPNGLIWGALLGACLVHSRADLAPYVARKLFNADPTNSAGYVMLSNAYAFDKRWSEIGELRGLMKVGKVRKQPGCSWISVDGIVHEFLVGSKYHPQVQIIYQTLDELFKVMRSVGHYGAAL